MGWCYPWGTREGSGATSRELKGGVLPIEYGEVGSANDRGRVCDWSEPE